MDARHFDALTRLMSTAPSRRRVLASLAGGLAGVVLGRAEHRDVSAQECTSALGDPCTVTEDCCNELVCGSDHVCTDFCIALGGGWCVEDFECCVDLMCVDLVCVVPGSCTPWGSACLVDEDCCNDACCGGVCSFEPECCPDHPNPSLQCPEGTLCLQGSCQVVDDSGTATVTIHLASCPTGTSDLFGACHRNGLGGVGFDVNGTITTGADGVAVTTVEAGMVTVVEDPSVVGQYLGSYVYCAEQTSGTVLYDGSADTATVSFEVADGDEVVCDWYNITAADDGDESDDGQDDGVGPDENNGDRGGTTTLPSTGTGSAEDDVTPWLATAAVGAAAAVVVGATLRKAGEATAPED